MLLEALKGNRGYSSRTRYVFIGSMAGDVISLSAVTVRSTDIQLAGSGLGSLSQLQIAELFSSILPEMFRLAADRKLMVETVQVPIADISLLWDMDMNGVKRLVVNI